MPVSAAIGAGRSVNVGTNTIPSHDHDALTLTNGPAEANATDDQTGAEIKTAYEGEADTNAFTDAHQTSLDNIDQRREGYETVTAAAAASINADVDRIAVNGRFTSGDAGPAEYRRVGSEPSHAGKFQDANSAWWEIVPVNNRVPFYAFLASASTATTNAAALQSADDFMNSQGGGFVTIPTGTTLVDEKINKNDNVYWEGTPGLSTIKLDDGANDEIVGRPLDNSDVDDIGFYGIIFDGNGSNQDHTISINSAVAFSGLNRAFFRHCSFINALGYGLGLQGTPGQVEPNQGTQVDIFLENCRFLDNGAGDGASTLFDGLDIKDGTRITVLKCYATGNSLDGIDIRGRDVKIIACSSDGNGQSGIQVKGNAFGESLEGKIDLIGNSCRNNTAAGIWIADGSGGAAQVVEVSISGGDCIGNGNGLRWTESTGNRVELTCRGLRCISNTDDGVDVQTTTARYGVFSACIFKNNTGSGAKVAAPRLEFNGCNLQNNAQYGLEEVGNMKTRIIGGSISGNTVGKVLDGGSIYTRGTFGLNHVASVLSPDVSLTSTSTQNITIAHGLDIAPGFKDIQLTMIIDPLFVVSDYVVDSIQVRAVDATNVTARVTLGTASATASAVGQLALYVDARPAPA